MTGKFNVGDLVRVKTHSDPIMRVVGIEPEPAGERVGADGVVNCEWEDHGTNPPTRRSYGFAAADLVPAVPRNA